MFWDAREGRAVHCSLCHQGCVIAEGRRGLCGVRENRDGRLVSLVYGRPAAQAVDPIEKKPLYHFLPGSQAFSIGTVGCNFRCLHCQNCDVSQVPADYDFALPAPVPPERMVAKAKAAGCASIAYTYTEPTIFYEYAYDTARLARDEGIRNIFVTNGYITPEALREIAPLLDAANIDLKFFRDDLYRRVCGARLQPVLDAIGLYRELGIWTEVTTLVIPRHNDDDAQLHDLAAFIAGVDPHIPWHVSAFYPTYKLTDVPPTDVPALERARDHGARAGLKYVYLGNVGGRAETRCPECRSAVVERSAFGLLRDRLEGGNCPECGARVAGVWKA